MGGDLVRLLPFWRVEQPLSLRTTWTAYLLRFSQKVGPLFASADTVNPSFLAVHCPIPLFPACYLIKKRRDERQWRVTSGG